jgi:beta-lactamase class A
MTSRPGSTRVEVEIEGSRSEFMAPSRRSFLASTLMAAAVPAAQLVAEGAVMRQRWLGQRIIDQFNRLPGRKALKILVPQAGPAGPWSVELNPEQMLFCASSFKVFVLTEFLRRVEAGTASLTELLPVDESVWSLGSPVLTPSPPTGVIGLIQARTALEAMIAHSDNTGTDMALGRVGADTLRAHIAEIGLSHTRIPNATRQFFGFVAGVPDWPTISWSEVLQAIENLPPSGPSILNDTQTMASTPEDFVSFYSRALQGQFFEQEQTLRTFRYILTQADAVPRIVPLGTNGFLKGGSIDFRDEHALSIAGGMFIPDRRWADYKQTLIPDRRWAYYSFMINWVDGEAGTVNEVSPLFAEVLGTILAWLRDEFR